MEILQKQPAQVMHKWLAVTLVFRDSDCVGF